MEIISTLKFEVLWGSGTVGRLTNCRLPESIQYNKIQPKQYKDDYELNPDGPSKQCSVWKFRERA